MKPNLLSCPTCKGRSYWRYRLKPESKGGEWRCFRCVGEPPEDAEVGELVIRHLRQTKSKTKTGVERD